MIIYSNKGFEQCSKFPAENLYPDNPDVLFVVDETIDEGKALAAKVMQLYPYYDFVTNEAGELVDVVDIRIKASVDIIQAVVDQVVTVTATLPTNTQDTEVVFRVDDGPDIVESVTNGQAEHSFAFSLPGVYTITVSSQNHGTAAVEVTVIA